jgi:hypothetical protein
MGINFPKDFLFLKIENFEFTLKVTKAIACVGGGTRTERSTLYASFVFDGRDNFKFTFGELMDFDKPRGFGSLTGEHELR